MVQEGKPRTSQKIPRLPRPRSAKRGGQDEVRGKYIYGVIGRGEKKEFGPVGIGDRGDKVYTIPYQDISAVVSDSQIVDYTHMLKDAVARLLLGHQKVIERIMSLEYTIIPMRLGTFASDEKEVRDILDKRYRVIRDIFRKMSDKIEIDVVATWSDFNSVLKEVGEEKEIKEFKEGFLANPKGITIEDQMKVGVMVKKALVKKREKYAFQIQNTLKAVSQEFKVHELMDDKMITNTAFLINKANQKDFDRRVEELNTEFSEKLNFRCVGPLPPYSFTTLEAKRMRFEEIEEARRRLGLGEEATLSEIKGAHRRLSQEFHPDKGSEQKKFEKITKAYKLLLDYCEGERCSFKKEAVKNFVGIRVLKDIGIQAGG